MIVREIKALEYRLNDAVAKFPAIYHVKNEDYASLFSRRCADYFVWNKKVYEKTSTSVEDDLLVIYLQESDETPFSYSIPYSDLGIEVRNYEEEKESTYETFINCQNHYELFSYLASDYITLLGREYEVISRETDEDRQTFVLYVKRT